MQKESEIIHKQNGHALTRLVEVVFYVLTIFHLVANFVASPSVRFSYLAICLLVIVITFTFKPDKAIWYFMIFSLFEGQGRILWGYAPWARIIFDFTLVGAVLRSIIVQKKVWDKSKLPTYLNVLITLHFVWFTIELFNPNGAGFFASFATAKFYIFPFLLFFYFVNNPIDIASVKNQRKILLILLILSTLSVLTIVQNINGESFMAEMSPNYTNLFKKFAVFQGYAFRPWGTSFVAGGMGSFYYMMAGFCFIFRPHHLTKNIVSLLFLSLIKYSSLLLIIYSGFIGEVRSAVLKTVSIVGTALVFRFIGSKQKFKKTTGVFACLLVIFLFSGQFNLDRFVAEYDLYSEVNRWTSLAEEGVSKQRGGFENALNWVSDRVDSPLGYGLGMTTDFLPAYRARRSAIPGTKLDTFWSMDNLFVFLILELGVGAIFYILIILSVLVGSFSMCFSTIRNHKMFEYSLISVSFATILWVVVGNWGAVALCYNPESFYFWFWVSLAFNEFRKCSGFVGKEKKLSLEDNELE